MVELILLLCLKTNHVIFNPHEDNMHQTKISHKRFYF